MAEKVDAEHVLSETALAPRVVEQKESARELSPFEGVNVIIESLAESEAWRTAGQVAWLLSDAGWNISPGMRRFVDITLFPKGITIETNGESREKEKTDL